VIYILVLLALAAGAFQLLALAAALRRLALRDPVARVLPPVSILKPVRGLDPKFYEGILSHARLDYPEFEILFGVSDPDDPAIAEIRRLEAEFPSVPIRLVVSSRRWPNAKVGVLADLAAEARHPVLVVNDSDIRVEPGYLRRVVAPLEDPTAGMVTCLYRGSAGDLAGRLEAVGAATDFAPGGIVAPLVGVREFALGSTMAFRARDLERIGGFAAIADFIADDYQLSRHIHGLGLRVVMSRCVVETSFGGSSWRDVWDHQLRWARTIRVSRGGGYFGLPLTNATLWAAALAGAGFWRAGLALLLLRLATGLVTGVLVLGDRALLSNLWLIPVRDLAGLAVWAFGLVGNTAIWRGKRLELTPDGRIKLPAPAPVRQEVESEDVPRALR
jgi:ceramide glucosyltransferase